VDVVGAIRSLNLFDVLVVFFVCVFFLAGFVQGTLRRLIGLAILVVAILFASTFVIRWARGWGSTGRNIRRNTRPCWRSGPASS